MRSDSELLLRGRFVVNLCGPLSVAAIIILAESAAAAVIQKDAEGGTVIIANGMMMKEFPTGEKAVFDSKLSVVTAVFPDRKIYTTFTREQFCGAPGTTDRYQVQMARPFSVLEVMQGGYQVAVKEGYTVQETSGEARVVDSQPLTVTDPSRPPSVRVVERGSGGRVAGYATKRFRVYVNGQLDEEVWMATDKRLLNELGKLNMKTILGFFQCDEQTTRGRETAAEQDQYRKLYEKGWPVKIEAEGDPNYFKVVSLEIRDVPMERFGVPKRYTAVPFQRMLLGIDDAEED